MVADFSCVSLSTVNSRCVFYQKIMCSSARFVILIAPVGPPLEFNHTSIPMFSKQQRVGLRCSSWNIRIMFIAEGQ